MSSTIFVPQNQSMSGEAKYASMQDLAEQLSELLQGIEDGTATIDDLDLMVGQARELYERLVVVRHKAFDMLNNEQEAEPQTFQLVDIVLSEEDELKSSSQTSLIDVIEEVEKEQNSSSEEPSKAEEDVTLEEQQPEPTRQTSILDIDEENQQEEEDDESEETVVVAAEVEEEKLQPAQKSAEKSHKESLAEKLGRTPIGDLKKAIALNQKFLFINELFAKDAEQYESAISTLNAFSELNDAEAYLEELAESLKWKEESEARETLLDLVERRYA